MSEHIELSSLINRAIRHWKKHGTISTVQKAHREYLRSQYRDSFSNQIMSRESLLEKARSTGNVWFGEPEGQFTIRDPPKEYEFDNLGGLTGQYNPDKRYLCELSNCHIIGPSAAGVWDEKYIILDTVSGNLKKFQQRFPDFFPVELCQDITFGELDRQKTQSISGPVLPLVPYQNQYYYHWLLEQLPKLRVLEQYVAENGTKPRLLIPSNPPSFVTESLELLGYSADQLIEWDSDIAAVGSLLVTNHRSYSPHREFYSPSQNDCEWVRDTFINQIDQPDGRSPSRRTYISRQEAERGRTVLNFDELKKWLSNQSFSVDVFEKHHFKRQVKITNSSEIIMGPTGAGMSNILFADDPLVVELTLKGWTRPFYFLSEILGHEFRPYICDANDSNDLYININELERQISNHGL